jgi:hypothetical protein
MGFQPLTGRVWIQFASCRRKRSGQTRHPPMTGRHFLEPGPDKETLMFAGQQRSVSSHFKGATEKPIQSRSREVWRTGLHSVS